MISPAKLNKGDEVRIIAPSRSLKILSDRWDTISEKTSRRARLKSYIWEKYKRM